MIRFMLGFGEGATFPTATDHYNLDLKNAALFSSAVFLAGVVGDTSGGIISDAMLRRTGDPSRHVAM
jgi:hypothetical protein